MPSIVSLTATSSPLSHDRDAGSIVLDAYLVPHTDSQVDQLSDDAFFSLISAKTRGINPRPRVTTLWKNMLPALVERCRRNRTHPPDRFYRQANRVPLATQNGDRILYACGEGKDLAGFSIRPECQPFAKLGTRIAIPVLFPVLYLER